MFARLLGKKKDPKAVKTKEELRTEMILNTTININNKIKLAEDKATHLGIKRALLMKQARAIKNNRDNGSKIQLKRLLISVKRCDTAINRQTAISLKLSEMRDTCEAYLDHCDFLDAIHSATVLVEQFGIKPEDADQLMEEMQDIKDRVGDIDGAVTFDSLDEDVDDLMKELDQPEEGDLLEDQSPALPSVPSKKPSTTTPVKSRSIPASTAEEELEAELNDL